jgi:sugar phosphate isomerase/epimerase
MEIRINDINGVKIAEVISDQVLLKGSQDAVDLIAEAGYQGCEKIILQQKNISSSFFDLKTGVAGEVLQKFSTYNMQLAIVADYSNYSSKRLADFIRESNKYGRVNFVSSITEAKEKLMKK